MLTLQNCIFSSAISQENPDEEGVKENFLSLDALKTYSTSALAHCHELLDYVAKHVSSLLPADPSGSTSALPPVVENVVKLLLNDSALALLPVLTSSLQWLLSQKSSTKHRADYFAVLGADDQIAKNLLSLLQRIAEIQVAFHSIHIRVLVARHVAEADHMLSPTETAWLRG